MNKLLLSFFNKDVMCSDHSSNRMSTKQFPPCTRAKEPQCASCPLVTILCCTLYLTRRSIYSQFLNGFLFPVLCVLLQWVTLVTWVSAHNPCVIKDSPSILFGLDFPLATRFCGREELEFLLELWLFNNLFLPFPQSWIQWCDALKRSPARQGYDLPDFGSLSETCGSELMWMFLPCSQSSVVLLNMFHACSVQCSIYCIRLDLVQTAKQPILQMAYIKYVRVALAT